MNYDDWHYYKKGIISNKADYEEVIVNKDDANELFHHFGGFYIRWLSDFDKSEKSNFYSVIRDKKIILEILPPKTRNMVRRCLKYCQIKIVNYKEIISRGGVFYIFKRNSTI